MPAESHQEPHPQMSSLTLVKFVQNFARSVCLLLWVEFNNIHVYMCTYNGFSFWSSPLTGWWLHPKTKPTMILPQGKGGRSLPSEWDLNLLVKLLGPVQHLESLSHTISMAMINHKTKYTIKTLCLESSTCIFQVQNQSEPQTVYKFITSETTWWNT